VLSKKTARIFIGLGSNVGDRQLYLERACHEMEIADITVIRRSSVFHSEAWGYVDQPPFLNQVIEIVTAWPPEQLLIRLQEIEKNMGRKIRKKWREREIDIDILYYGDHIIQTSNLQIPHRYVRERNFVLVPLAEIAGEFKDPVSGETINEVMELSTDESIVKKYNSQE
jgi:2-amino-4-hydroxy-6-hydroxymethyldihydropteridine diphosphokinase